MSHTSSHIAGLPSRKSVWMQEIPVLLGLATGAVALSHWSPAGPMTGGTNLLWTGWILICILTCAFRAMLQAEALAVQFGEPIGTIILTVSAITIEVAAVAAMMLPLQEDNSVARDTMFAVLMLIFNLLIGLAILLGGLRKRSQEFNPGSSSNYLSFIIALGTIALILPTFTHSEQGGWMSDSMEIYVGITCLVIYILFLISQTSASREFFEHKSTEKEKIHAHAVHHSIAITIMLLVISLGAVVMLAESVGARVTVLFQTWNMPAPLSGIFIAALVLAPEGLAALRASREDDMQRSINVLLGSALATIGLTVPAVIVMRYVTGVSPELGLEPPYIALFVLTFAVSIVNLMRGRVNMMQGVVHLLIFATWIMVIFDESWALNV